MPLAVRWSPHWRVKNTELTPKFIEVEAIIHLLLSFFPSLYHSVSLKQGTEDQNGYLSEWNRFFSLESYTIAVNLCATRLLVKSLGNNSNSLIFAEYCSLVKRPKPFFRSLSEFLLNIYLRLNILYEKKSS